MNMRAAEIMAEAQLAPFQLQRAQLQGQQAAQNTQQWTSLLSTVPQLAGTLINVGKQSADESAANDAQTAIANARGNTGAHALLPGAEYGAQPDMTDPTSYAKTPGDVAADAVANNSALNPAKPKDFLAALTSGDPFGFRQAAAAKARAQAATGIASEVDRAREQQSKNDDADFAQGRLRTSDTYAAQDRARSLIPSYVSAGIANGQSPDDLAAGISEAPGVKGVLDDNEIHALAIGHYVKQKSALMDADTARNVAAQKAADEHTEAVQRAALFGREHTAGAGGPGKPLPADQLDAQISHPRAVISSLDTLKDASTTAPSGMQAGAGDALGKVPIVGPSAQELVAPGQQDYEGKVAIALANVNNAMDKRVSADTLKLWQQQLSNPALTPAQRAKKIEEIKGFLSTLQDAREQALSSSGYRVPSNPATSPPAANASGARVNVIDPHSGQLVSIPQSALAAALADGARIVR